MGELRTKITIPIAKFTSPRISDTTFFACWHGKTGPSKITTKAEGRTESRSSCHRCITIYCIKALVRGLKGIAFHSNNEIIYMYRKSSIKLPLSNKPPPSIIAHPFSGEDRVSYKLPPPPSIKQVQMVAAGGLSLSPWKRPRGIAVLLPFGLDASSLLISLPICHSLFIFCLECRSEGL